jgi:phage terminase small subunit
VLLATVKPESVEGLPLRRLALNLAATVKGLLSEMGLSPTARARVPIVKEPSQEDAMFLDFMRRKA